MPLNILISDGFPEVQNRYIYLALSIGPGAGENTCSQEHYTEYLDRAVSLASQEPCNHRSDASKASKDNVNGNTNVVGESPIVEHVDAKMHGGDYSPSSNRYLWSLQSIWTSWSDLTRVGCQCCEEELEKCN